MAYLDNTELTVDAILTKKGRQKLASGQELGIIKFALGDDEIDYTLYKSGHPKGPTYNDSAIKAMPITEATPDETQILRYKLVTLPNGSTSIPTVSIGMPNITKFTGEGLMTITPSTSPEGNKNSGYTAILSDGRAGTLVGNSNSAGDAALFLGESIGATATVVTGDSFSFTPSSTLKFSLTTTLTVYGNETGGSISVPVVVTYKE